MRNLSTKNTILLHLKNKDIIKILKRSIGEIKLNTFLVKHKEDIIAVPSFLLIIDSTLITEDVLELLNEMKTHENPTLWSVLILGKTSFQINKELKKFITVFEKDFLSVDFKKIISTKLKAALREQNRLNKVNNKIYRIIKLYADLMIHKAPKELDIEEYCTSNGISKRTLRRDLRILKDLFPDFTIYTKGSWMG